jgi:predicted ATPase
VLVRVFDHHDRCVDVASEPHIRLRYFCSPQHTDSALYPIISQMERAAGFGHVDTVQAKLNKIDAILAQSSTSPQDTTLLIEMLSISNDGRYPKLELTPEQRRQKTMEALTAKVEALSRSNPVLMAFEDVHWADPTSLEVLGRTVDRLRTLGVLLIITYRSEFDAPWMGRSYVTTLNLNRLGEREVAALVERVIRNRSLPESIRQDIIERTDGIPLFVEEMTRAVLEAESEGDARSTAAAIPSSLSVPASLHASLMARLDRLGPAKEVAQIGAAIGREFSHALLSAVAARPEADVCSALDRIIAAGLLFRQGGAPQATYLFKHALVQDAAYGTLLREPRRALHTRIAEAIESQFAEIADTQPELLARHYMEAGQIKTAATLWGKAGQRSLERSALVEAIEQLTRALSLLATLASSPDLRREQIKLQVALINPLMHVKGFAAPETKTAAERARQLVEQAEAFGERLEDPLTLFSILYGFWVANQVAFNGDRIRELAEQFLVLAKKQADTVPLRVGHRLMGTSLMQTASLAPARAHLDQAMALCEANNRPQATRFGIDVRISILCYRSWALWMLGYPEAALADAEHALDEVRQIDQAATLLYALLHVSFTHMFCGKYEAATAEATALLALAKKKDTALWKASGVMNQGDLLALVGRVSDAVPMIISGIAAYQLTGATIYIPWHLSCLAWAHADLSQFDEAQRCSDQAIAVVETTNERWAEAEVHRIVGEVALMSPDRNASTAEDCFERSRQRRARLRPRRRSSTASQILGTPRRHGLDHGVLLVDGRGHVLFANRAAEAIIALRDGLIVVSEGLRAALPADTARACKP